MKVYNGIMYSAFTVLFSSEKHAERIPVCSKHLYSSFTALDFYVSCVYANVCLHSSIYPDKAFFLLLDILSI